MTVLDRYGHLLPGSEERVTGALDAIAEAALPRDGRAMEPKVTRLGGGRKGR